jgi:Zn-dependent protease with chaperone function
MAWLAFTIISYLFSLLGFAVYRTMVRSEGSPRQRKQFLLLMTTTSLLVPILILSKVELRAFTHLLRDYASAPQPATVTIQENITPEFLVERFVCYREAMVTNDFCKCEQVREENIILYKSNAQYNFLIQLFTISKWILSGIALVLLGLLLSRLYKIHQLTKNAIIQPLYIQHKQYRILYNNNFLAASFYLFRRYIVWGNALNELPEKRAKAILYHEVAHIQQRDTWLQVAFSMLHPVWLLNPVFYYLRSELKLLNELLADAFAIKHIGDARSYALMLIRLKEVPHHNELLQSLGDSFLKERIHHIIYPKSLNISLFSPILVLIILLELGTAITAAPAIRHETKAYNEYYILHEEHKLTGLNYFCKECIFNNIHHKMHVTQPTDDCQDDIFPIAN